MDAGPKPAPELTLAIHLVLADGGAAELPIEPGSRPLIDPPAEMDLTSNLPLRDYRVRVFDDGDRVVPSDDQGHETDAGTDYRIRFVEPLKTGRRYAVLVDAQTGDALTDASGRTHPEVRVDFQTSGERERPAKKHPKHRK